MFQLALFNDIARVTKVGRYRYTDQEFLPFNPRNVTVSASRGEMTITWIDNVLRGCVDGGLKGSGLPSLADLQVAWNAGQKVAEAIKGFLANRPIVVNPPFVPIFSSTAWAPPARLAWVGPLALPAPVKVPGVTPEPSTDTDAPTATLGHKPRQKVTSKPTSKGRTIVARGPAGTLERDPAGKLVATFRGYQDRAALRKLGVRHMATASYTNKGDWSERYQAEDTPRLAKLLTLMVRRKNQPVTN